MAADKHAVSAAQATSLGMLTPAAGIAALETLLRGAILGSAHSAVRGAASAGYWQRLLQGVKEKPGLFAALGKAPAAQVPCSCLLLLWAAPHAVPCAWYKTRRLNVGLVHLQCEFTQRLACKLQPRHTAQAHRSAMKIAVMLQVEEEASASGKDRGSAVPTRKAAAVATQAELQSAIAGVVRELVGADVDADVALASQGLDSLTAMELRQKLQVRLGSFSSGTAKACMTDASPACWSMHACQTQLQS